MPGFDRIVLTPFGLPPRREPASDQGHALWVLAVTLVPAPRLVLTATAFAQAYPHPRSSRAGTLAAVWAIMTGAHGSAISQGTVRGERAIVLLGRFSQPGSGRCSSLPCCHAGMRQGSRRLEKGMTKEPRNGQPNGSRQVGTRGVQGDGEGNDLIVTQARRP